MQFGGRRPGHVDIAQQLQQQILALLAALGRQQGIDSGKLPPLQAIRQIAQVGAQLGSLHRRRLWHALRKGRDTEQQSQQ
nr:hypothetical protein [Aeromonas jandaei]